MPLESQLASWLSCELSSDMLLRLVEDLNQVVAARPCWGSDTRVRGQLLPIND